MKRLPLTRVLICALLLSASGARADGPTTSPSTSGGKFLRYIEEPDGGKLEASVVTYRNKDGVTVDLIAAIHIADAGFFEKLDKSFVKYDSLLYELVKPRDVKPPGGAATRPATTKAAAKPKRSLAYVGMLQRFMRDKLQLTFQLEEIDYTAKNFVHADMDMETFQEMQEQRGESMLSLMLDSMLAQMKNPQAAAAAAAQPGLMDLLKAMQSPDAPRQMKLLLGRQFGELDDMLGGWGVEKGTVILDERNKAALAKLSERIKAGDRKIGIFYGAAHLKKMEKTLTAEMGFTQVGEPVWSTAWDMTVDAKGPATKPAKP